MRSMADFHSDNENSRLVNSLGRKVLITSGEELRIKLLVKFHEGTSHANIYSALALGHGSEKNRTKPKQPNTVACVELSEAPGA